MEVKYDRPMIEMHFQVDIAKIEALITDLNKGSFLDERELDQINLIMAIKAISGMVAGREIH